MIFWKFKSEKYWNQLLQFMFIREDLSSMSILVIILKNGRQYKAAKT